MKKYIILSILLVSSALLLAVFDDYQPSARARGMGGAFTAVADDANAIFFNPAGLADLGFEGNFGYTRPFNESFSDVKTLALAAELPKRIGTIGFGAKLFDVNFEDESLYGEQTWTLSHAFTLQKDIHSTINFGYNLNYLRLKFDDDDSDHAFGIDLGATALLHNRTKLGFAVSNLGQAKMGFENQIKLPSKLSLGISYIPYDGVVTTLEVKKDFAEETEFMGGVEARIFDPLYIRVGVHQNPATYSAGASFVLAGVQLDYATTYHSVLGLTHALNLGYRY